MPRTLPRTHQILDARFSGEPVEIEPGRATVRLETIPVMAADERGLVHGGFLFSAADHAAMLAVNEPTVVLAGAETSFLAPVRVGETVTFQARIEEGTEGSRPRIECRGTRGGDRVFQGTFRCVVLREHVLEETS